MQIQQLTYFVAIAEQGSINKAAEKLFVTQPNLSKAISNLENELKVRIFNRTNKGVALTDEGKKLYQYARTIINQMELIQGLSEKEHAPVLSIASYPIITMGRLMAKFYNNYHDNRVALKLVENRLQQVIESVEHGEAEIGFVMSNNVQVKELKHMLKFKNLQFHALGTDTWYANIGPNHPLYHASEVTMEQLLPHPFVRLPDDYFSNLSFYLEIDGVRRTVQACRLRQRQRGHPVAAALDRCGSPRPETERAGLRGVRHPHHPDPKLSGADQCGLDPAQPRNAEHGSTGICEDAGGALPEE